MVQLLFSHLLYDIEQQTHALATARLNENPDVKAEAQIDQSEHLSDIAMRYCEEGVAFLKTLLKNKLEQPNWEEDGSPVTPPENDTLIYDRPSWDFPITIPDIDDHTLATLFHRFVLAYVLWQWTKLYAPNESAQFKAQLDETRLKIEKTLYTMGTPRKRRPHYAQVFEPTVTIESE